MDKKDLYALRYYIGFGVIVIGFYMYSAITGYRWFNPTQTEPTRSGGRAVHGTRFYGGGGHHK
jgi:hypothetical protein